MRKGNILAKNTEEKITKNKRKHNKKQRKVRIYFVLIAFVLSIFLIGIFCIYHLRTSSKYNLKNAKYVSNKVYSVQDLANIAKLEVGKNIFKVDKGRIIENLKTLPYVENVDISIKLPDTLVINIKEYSSNYLAYNKEKNEYYRLSKNGVILEKTDGESKKENELLVFGISFVDNIIFKEKISLTELQKLEKFEKIYDEYNKKGITKKITCIEFKEDNVILTLDYDLNIILNDKNIEYDILFLKSILENLVYKAGTIDMTKTNPIYTESIK